MLEKKVSGLVKVFVVVLVAAIFLASLDSGEITKKEFEEQVIANISQGGDQAANEAEFDYDKYSTNTKII